VLNKWKNRIEMIASFGAGRVGAEIGVFSGEFTSEIVKNNPKELVLVDAWQQLDDDFVYTNLEDQYNLVMSLYGHDERIRIIKDLSLEAVKLFPDEYFDFVYLDANHAWFSITNDIYYWWKKVKINGYLCGHDYIHP
jgi:hypothetical protein